MTGYFHAWLPPVTPDEQMEHDQRKLRCAQRVMPVLEPVTEQIVDCESLPNIAEAIAHARKMREMGRG